MPYYYDSPGVNPGGLFTPSGSFNSYILNRLDSYSNYMPPSRSIYSSYASPLSTITEINYNPSTRRLVNYSMPHRYSNITTIDTEKIDVTTPKKPDKSDSGDDKTFGTIKRGRTVVRMTTKQQKDVGLTRDRVKQKPKKSAGEKLKEKYLVGTESVKKKHYYYKRPTLNDLRNMKDEDNSSSDKAQSSFGESEVFFDALESLDNAAIGRSVEKQNTNTEDLAKTSILVCDEKENKDIGSILKNNDVANGNSSQTKDEKTLVKTASESAVVEETVTLPRKQTSTEAIRKKKKSLRKQKQTTVEPIVSGENDVIHTEVKLRRPKKTFIGIEITEEPEPVLTSDFTLKLPLPELRIINEPNSEIPLDINELAHEMEHLNLTSERRLSGDFTFNLNSTISEEDEEEEEDDFWRKYKELQKPELNYPDPGKSCSGQNENTFDFWGKEKRPSYHRLARPNLLQPGNKSPEICCNTIEEDENEGGFDFWGKEKRPSYQRISQASGRMSFTKSPEFNRKSLKDVEILTRKESIKIATAKFALADEGKAVEHDEPKKNSINSSSILNVTTKKSPVSSSPFLQNKNIPSATKAQSVSPDVEMLTGKESVKIPTAKFALPGEGKTVEHDEPKQNNIDSSQILNVTTKKSTISSSPFLQNKNIPSVTKAQSASPDVEMLTKKDSIKIATAKFALADEGKAIQHDEPTKKNINTSSILNVTTKKSPISSSPFLQNKNIPSATKAQSASPEFSRKELNPPISPEFLRKGVNSSPTTPEFLRKNNFPKSPEISRKNSINRNASRQSIRKSISNSSSNSEEENGFDFWGLEKRPSYFRVNHPNTRSPLIISAPLIENKSPEELRKKLTVTDKSKIFGSRWKNATSSQELLLGNKSSYKVETKTESTINNNNASTCTTKVETVSTTSNLEQIVSKSAFGSDLTQQTNEFSTLISTNVNTTTTTTSGNGETTSDIVEETAKKTKTEDEVQLQSKDIIITSDEGSEKDTIEIDEVGSNIIRHPRVKDLSRESCSSSSGGSSYGSTRSSIQDSTTLSAGPSCGSASSNSAKTVSSSLSEESEEEPDSLKDKYDANQPEIRPKYRVYSLDDFQFLKVLGKGSFGKVLLAELKETNTYFAVKCLKKDVVLEDDDVECTMIERKVLLIGSKHPYLCHLLCTFQSESHLFFAMEYLNGGDLMFHIQQSGKFAEDRGRFYAAEIVSGLKFLHKKGVIYRDLKLDNILLDSQGHVRIADFGMCKLQIFLDRTADTFCGTPDYMAPEIIKGLRYNQCVDWWAFGVLLYEMLVGQSPFSGSDEDQLFWAICNESVKYPRFLSREAKRLMELLLEKDGYRRLGSPGSPYGDIKDQSFFKLVDWDKLEKCELEPPFKPKLRSPLDVKYFDTTFTKEVPKLTVIDRTVLRSMDQSQFNGFSYTNPHTTD